MRLSEFWFVMDQEFGPAYARVLARDLTISELGSRTVAEALSAGVSPRDAWYALCRAQDVPEERWHGAHLMKPATERSTS